jgi:hypothetical protein
MITDSKSLFTNNDLSGIVTNVQLVSKNKNSYTISATIRNKHHEIKVDNPIGKYILEYGIVIIENSKSIFRELSEDNLYNSDWWARPEQRAMVISLATLESGHIKSSFTQRNKTGVVSLAPHVYDILDEPFAIPLYLYLQAHISCLTAFKNLDCSDELAFDLFKLAEASYGSMLSNLSCLCTKSTVSKAYSRMIAHRLAHLVSFYDIKRFTNLIISDYPFLIDSKLLYSSFNCSRLKNINKNMVEMVFYIFSNVIKNEHNGYDELIDKVFADSIFRFSLSNDIKNVKTSDGLKAIDLVELLLCFAYDSGDRFQISTILNLDSLIDISASLHQEVRSDTFGRIKRIIGDREIVIEDCEAISLFKCISDSDNENIGSIIFSDNIEIDETLASGVFSLIAANQSWDQALTFCNKINRKSEQHLKLLSIFRKIKTHSAKVDGFYPDIVNAIKKIYTGSELTNIFSSYIKTKGAEKEAIIKTVASMDIQNVIENIAFKNSYEFDLFRKAFNLTAYDTIELQNTLNIDNINLKRMCLETL